MNIRYCAIFFSFFVIFQIDKNIIFLDYFKRFIALRNNYFESGWEWLTTAVHTQKWLVVTEISAAQGEAGKHVDF